MLGSLEKWSMLDNYLTVLMTGVKSRWIQWSPGISSSSGTARSLLVVSLLICVYWLHPKFLRKYYLKVNTLTWFDTICCWGQKVMSFLIVSSPLRLSLPLWFSPPACFRARFSQPPSPDFSDASSISRSSKSSSSYGLMWKLYSLVEQHRKRLDKW